MAKTMHDRNAKRGAVREFKKVVEELEKINRTFLGMLFDDAPEGWEVKDSEGRVVKYIMNNYTDLFTYYEGYFQYAAERIKASKKLKYVEIDSTWFHEMYKPLEHE